MIWNLAIVYLALGALVGLRMTGDGVVEAIRQSFREDGPWIGTGVALLVSRDVVVRAVTWPLYIFDALFFRRPGEDD